MRFTGSVVENVKLGSGEEKSACRVVVRVVERTR